MVPKMKSIIAYLSVPKQMKTALPDRSCIIRLLSYRSNVGCLTNEYFVDVNGPRLTLKITLSMYLGHGINPGLMMRILHKRLHCICKGLVNGSRLQILFWTDLQ